jgi:hypothetical protein
VRARLNIGADVADATITALVSAARLKIERRYGVAMLTQTLDYVQDRFPGHWGGDYCDGTERGFYPAQNYRRAGGDIINHQGGRSDIVIPMSPIQTVASVSYLDSGGASQVLDSSLYVLTKGDIQSRVSHAVNTSWPATQLTSGSVKVRLVAGFGDSAADVPETLKMAVLLEVSHLRSLTANNLFLSLDSVTGVGEKRYIVGSGSGDVISAAVSALMQDYIRPSL